MNIIIFGASGATGQQLVTQALRRGHRVTAFLRETSILKIVDPHLHVVRGDIGDLQQVSEALNGQDAVLSALGASSPFRYDNSVVDGFKVIIRATQDVQVNRFVYLSFMGVSDSREDGGVVVKYIAPVILASEIKGHETRERMLIDSDLGWTIVRPPTLTNGKRKGLYRSGEDVRSKHFAATISRADVAEFMLDQITSKEYLRSKVAVMY